MQREVGKTREDLTAKNSAGKLTGAVERKAHEGNRTLDLFFTKEVLYH
jgi:hypothetical protein